MTKAVTFDNTLAFAQNLIRIPSPSGHEGEVAALVRYEMESLGFRDIRTDEVGNVIGVVPGAGTAPRRAAR